MDYNYNSVHSNMIELTRVPIDHIINEVFPDKKLLTMPYDYWRQYDHNTRLNVMLAIGCYSLPTDELMDWFEDNCNLDDTIEIGCGNGFIGRELGIPFTDSKQQESAATLQHLANLKQPPVYYPDDVEKLNYTQAINKYKPKTVIGSFITHKWSPDRQELGGNVDGVDGNILISKIKKYILLGNLSTHKNNPLLKKKHKEYHFEWLITRGGNPALDRLFVWTK